MALVDVERAAKAALVNVERAAKAALASLDVERARAESGFTDCACAEAPNKMVITLK